MRILVVDDDRLARAVMGDLLREAAYEVLEAPDVAAARQLLPTCEVAVIDMVLPDEPGLALLPEVTRRGLAAVMVTAAQHQEEQLEAMRQGAYDVLHKPLEPEELAMAVARAAERATLARENRELVARLDERARQLDRERERLAVEVERRAGLIARAKEEWERTFDAIREPIAVVEDGCRVVRANRAFATWAGVLVTEVPGKACHEALFGLPRPCDGCPRRLADERGTAGATLELEGRTVRVSAFRVEPTSGGETASARGRSVVVYEDVTEARRLAQRLQDSERLAAVAKLAAGVAHEINNPLAFVAANLRSVCETCRELAERADDLEPHLRERLADAVEALGEAGQGADRVKGVVRALRLIADERAADGRPLDMAESLERVAAQVSRADESKPAVTVRWEGRTEAAAQGDALRLDQALRELVRNAFQATPPGGTIRLRTFAEGDRVVAEVADEGPGMPLEVRRRVFEPFFTTRAVGRGMGLGLTIAYGTIRQMKGEIRIESDGGRGTRVAVLLPAARAQPSIRET